MIDERFRDSDSVSCRRFLTASLKYMVSKVSVSDPFEHVLIQQSNLECECDV